MDPHIANTSGAPSDPSLSDERKRAIVSGAPDISSKANDSDTSSEAQPSRRKRRVALLSRFHIGLAVVGTLSAVAGIAIAIDGGFEFNRTKVFAGIGVIVVSTVFYIVMIFVPDEDKA
ncbi:hypothetical protein [Pararobbsia alpina]|uniref:hypothetical protein n=1 Tax=Pararobbsia alpina TaxID=621374 RepID=UPI0039A75A2C